MKEMRENFISFFVDILRLDSYNFDSDNMIEIIGNQIILEDGYEIKEYYTEKGIVRALCVKDCVQSLTYIDENLRNELCDPYFYLYNLPIDLNPTGQDYLVLGGGTFSYPKYFMSHYFDKKMTVVELDSKMVEYAKKYFYFDSLLEGQKDRLDIVIADALEFVKEDNHKYDFILIDLFDGKEPIKEAFSILNLNYLKKILAKNGIIIANYIVSKENRKTLSQDLQFASKIMKHFRIISTQENYDRENQIGNLLFIMSDNAIEVPFKYNAIDVTNTIIK